MLVWKDSEGWQDKGQAVGMGCMVGFRKGFAPSLLECGGAFLKKRVNTTTLAPSPSLAPA